MSRSFRDQARANAEFMPREKAALSAMSSSTLEDLLEAVERGEDFDANVVRVATVHQRQDIAVLNLTALLCRNELRSIRRRLTAAVVLLALSFATLLSRAG